MAKIYEKSDLIQINKELKVLFAQHETNLLSFCRKHKEQFPFRRTYERLNRNSITESELNEIIQTLDKNISIKKVKNNWKIS
jgi:2-hydroxy-3-keto-5-methylthiopentenyl-1-phosphate phosphatase